MQIFCYHFLPSFPKKSVPKDKKIHKKSFNKKVFCRSENSEHENFFLFYGLLFLKRLLLYVLQQKVPQRLSDSLELFHFYLTNKTVLLCVGRENKEYFGSITARHIYRIDGGQRTSIKPGDNDNPR